MNRPVDITTRPQVALQSYLDALLQEATEELPVAVEPEPVSELDEFQAAVLEEQARDAMAAQALVAPVALAPVPAPVEV
ncbi:chemotaxis protein CheW, partial [Pseudomonas gingeri]|nr:chemotaxis protein CheW [Pseudomonas gingeri]